jgi:hypothetical protein
VGVDEGDQVDVGRYAGEEPLKQFAEDVALVGVEVFEYRSRVASRGPFLDDCAFSGADAVEGFHSACQTTARPPLRARAAKARGSSGGGPTVRFRKVNPPMRAAIPRR